MERGLNEYQCKRVGHAPVTPTNLVLWVHIQLIVIVGKTEPHEVIGWPALRIRPRLTPLLTDPLTILTAGYSAVHIGSFLRIALPPKNTLSFDTFVKNYSKICRGGIWGIGKREENARYRNDPNLKLFLDRWRIIVILVKKQQLLRAISQRSRLMTGIGMP